jgi:hypothetical protein
VCPQITIYTSAIFADCRRYEIRGVPCIRHVLFQESMIVAHEIETEQRKGLSTAV